VVVLAVAAMAVVVAERIVEAGACLRLTPEWLANPRSVERDLLEPMSGNENSSRVALENLAARPCFDRQMTYHQVPP
jgi:hypothetical protein